MVAASIALIGDFNPEVLAHRAIEKCFLVAAKSGFLAVQPTWIGTKDILPGDERQFEEFRGFWCVPGSPYRNLEGALGAIRYARMQRVPFLGTCGGFQHALLEYARNVLNLQGAEHAEISPNSSLPLLSKMHCSLVEQTKEIKVSSGAFERIYGGRSGLEEFHCSYGLNPLFENAFDHCSLEIVARSDEGEAQAFMLNGHPFFVGTLFQPERRALSGSLHPIVRQFFETATGASAELLDGSLKSGSSR